jgi:hypothetical protein
MAMGDAENWEFFYRQGKRDWGWRLRKNRALVKSSSRLFVRFNDCLKDAVQSGFDGRLSGTPGKRRARNVLSVVSRD